MDRGWSVESRRGSGPRHNIAVINERFFHSRLIVVFCPREDLEAGGGRRRVMVPADPRALAFSNGM